MNPIRRHLSYANIVATLALLFAMSGGALAAKHYLVNSTKQINPKVLRKLKGARGAQGAHGLAGANGTQGPVGPGGPIGPKGQTGTIETANFYDKSEADKRFAAGNTKFMAGRLSTGLISEHPTVLEIPGIAKVIVLNCQAASANAEIDKIGSGTDVWVANGTGYAAPTGIRRAHRSPKTPKLPFTLAAATDQAAVSPRSTWLRRRPDRNAYSGYQRRSSKEADRGSAAKLRPGGRSLDLDRGRAYARATDQSAPALRKQPGA